MDKRNCLFSVLNIYPKFVSLICDCIKHCVSSCISSIASSPFFCPTKVAWMDISVSKIIFCNCYFFTINNRGSITFLNPSPRHTISSQLANSFRRSSNKHSRHILVATPVASFYCVCKVQVFIIAITFYRVTKTCLHTTLSSRWMASFNRHKR